MKCWAKSIVMLFVFLACGTAAGFRSNEVAEEALQGFEQILDFWRAEDYERLFSHLDYGADHGWEYLAQRIVYASRIPACCWEKLQEVRVTVHNGNLVVINAKVGFEVEGVGTRFVTRDFPLRRVHGVWKLPLHLVLDLAEYNLQRIPRKVYERPP